MEVAGGPEYIAADEVPLPMPACMQYKEADQRNALTNRAGAVKVYYFRGSFTEAPQEVGEAFSIQLNRRNV